MGDIRKSIREEVGKKLKKPNSRWNPDTQPNIYELSNFLQKSGYRLVDILVHEDYPELLIEAIKPGYLFPEISHDIKERILCKSRRSWIDDSFRYRRGYQRL